MPRTRQLPAVLVAAMLVPAALAAPAAHADDASVKAAWDSEDAAFTKLGKDERRELRRWQDRGYTRDGKLLAYSKTGEELTRKVLSVVEAEQPSTPQGTQAKALVVESLTSFAELFVANRTFVRAMRPGKSAKAQAAEREVIRLDRRARAKAKEALALFKEVGIE